MNSQDLNIKDGSFLLEESFNEFLTLNHMAKELYLISFVNFHHTYILALYTRTFEKLGVSRTCTRHRSSNCSFDRSSSIDSLETTNNTMNCRPGKLPGLKNFWSEFLSPLLAEYERTFRFPSDAQNSERTDAKRAFEAVVDEEKVLFFSEWEKERYIDISKIYLRNSRISVIKKIYSN